MKNRDLLVRAPKGWAKLAAGVALCSALVHCSSGDSGATRNPSSKTTTNGGAAGSSATTGGAGTGVGTGGSGTGGSGTGAGASGGFGGAGNAGGAAGSSAGSGGALPPPIRDAGSDISFDWPEGTTGKACKPGVYQGSFQCTYMQNDAGGLGFPVSGPISLKMVQSQQGEFLEVREGLLDGTANVFFTFRADISGKLDCKASRFEGRLENGVYSGFLVVNGTFQGPLSSSYDRVASQFANGVWSLAVDTGGGGCNGNWSASYVGPAD